MMEQDFITKSAPVNVDIDLRGGNILVAEHLLDGAQVGSPLKQMGGK